MALQLVVRPRLHAQLTAGLASPCVLIAAPAGWGKTLLASSWLRADGATGAAAWISLGPEEDDLRAFWMSLAHALLPAVGDHAGEILRNAVAADDLEQVPGQFAAALAADAAPVVVVIDNLHEVTGLAVHGSGGELGMKHAAVAGEGAAAPVLGLHDVLGDCGGDP